MNAAAAAAPAPAPAPAPAALSAGCTSEWAGDGDGAGPEQKEAGRARPGPRNPCLLSAPPADCGGRGAPTKGDPAKAPYATAPPRDQARNVWRGPAPCRAGEGKVGADPECSHWRTAGMPRPQPSKDSSQERVSRLLLQPGVSRGNRNGAGLRTLVPPRFYHPQKCPALLF